jgi:hypothetical protein
MTGMILWIPWSRINVDDASATLFSRAIQFSPNMGLSARLDDPPTFIFRMFDRFANVLVRMSPHRATCRTLRLLLILRHRNAAENRIDSDRLIFEFSSNIATSDGHGTNASAGVAARG